MEELWSSQALFYSMNETYSNFVQMRYLLDEEIDRAVLQKALDTTIERYPYFKVKMARCGEELVLIDNDAPLIVYEDAEAPTMEPARNGEYLMRVSAKGSLLNLSFCHAMTDGRGMTPFVRTLLHYYWMYRTGADSGMPDVRLAGTEIPLSEIRDPMLDFKQSPDALNLSRKNEAVFNLPVSSDPTGRRYVFTFSMDSDSFMKYSHENDGSPNALAALFMARAIRQINPGAENIVAGVAVDHRPAMGISDGHHCSIGLLYLPYLPKMENMDISTCATCYRGMIILQSDAEAAQAGLAASQQFNGYMRSLKTMEEKCKTAEYAVIRGSSTATFSVSYIGKQDYGKINDHIRFISVLPDTLVMHIGMEIMSIDGVFFVTATQDFTDPIYVRTFMDELESAGIHCLNYREESVPYEKAPVPSAAPQISSQ